MKKRTQYLIQSVNNRVLKEKLVLIIKLSFGILVILNIQSQGIKIIFINKYHIQL